MTISSVGQDTGYHGSENYKSAVGSEKRRVDQATEGYPQQVDQRINEATDIPSQKRMAVESGSRTESDIQHRRTIKSTKQDRVQEARHVDSMERQTEQADIVSERYDKEWAAYNETSKKLDQLEAFSRRAEARDKFSERRDEIDRARDQERADQMLQNISDTASGTKFDIRKPAKVNMADEERSRNPRGTTQKMVLENETLKNLGLNDYSVQGQIDVKPIEDAKKLVEEAEVQKKTKAPQEAFVTQTAQMDSQQFVATTVGRTEDYDTSRTVSDQQKSAVVKDYASMAVKAREIELRTTVTELVNP